ncbi:MAG: HNH endonuclease [Gordonia sp. (in: high G+C Gram-positive bacteria)]
MNTAESVRQLTRERALTLCERCGRPGHDVHHRRPRQMGGTQAPSVHSVTNTVLLCRACHAWAERYREAAYRDGWLVHSWDDPARIPIIPYLYRQTCWLDEHGGYVLYPPESDQP